MLKSIPAVNLLAFEEKFMKLQSIAAKLGCAIPDLVEIRTFKVPFWPYPELPSTKIMVTYHEFDLSDISPKFSDYEFVACIDHVEGIITGTGQYEIPNHFSASHANCEHCNTVRNRSQTYVIRNEKTGVMSQVGGDCLKHYLGHTSPLQLAAYFSSIFQFISQCEEGPMFGSKAVTNFDNGFVLQLAAHFTSKGGYKKSDSDYSTKWEVLGTMQSTEPAARKDVEDSRDKAGMVEEIIEWTKTLGDNEFGTNVKNIIANNYCTMRSIGILCCLPHLYLKQKADALQAALSPSKHQGEVGLRMKGLELTCIGVHEFEHDYGYSAFVTFVDSTGNIFKWKASANWPENGGLVILTGTVKEHGEYNGKLETALTRCKWNYVGVA